jgi:hypothetical protein
MAFFLTLALFASMPLLWFFPVTTTVIVGLVWLLLFVIVSGTQRTTKFRAGLLSPEEAEIASMHGFYFRMPSASTGISNGSTFWQLFTVIWAIHLGIRGLWWYLPVPIVVHLISAYLRHTCHPVFFAQEGIRVYGGTQRGAAFEFKLQLLLSAYEKLYGDGRPSSTERSEQAGDGDA